MVNSKPRITRKVLAGLLVLVFALATMPFGGILSIAKAQIPSQFNTNLSIINSKWGTMDASRSGSDLIYDQVGEGVATIMINITDTDMQTAIDTSTVTIKSVMGGSTAGFSTPQAGEPEFKAELFISCGVDAGSTYSAAPSGSTSHTITGDGTFTLDTGGATIPAGTRWIMIKAAVTTPNPESGSSAVTTLSNSNTVIGDTELPTMDSSYSADWTNQDVVVTITASDNIGTMGIYDDNDNLLTTEGSYAYTVTNEGENSASFYAKDYAENKSETLSVVVTNIDRTPPNDITAPTYNNSWTNQPVVVAFENLTQTAGTSPLSYTVSLDGGSTFNTFTGNEYSLTADGEVTSIYKVVDEAGNESSNTVSATTKYDGVAPSIDNIDVTRLPGKNKYNITVSDAHSGISEVKYAIGFKEASYFEGSGIDITSDLEFTSLTAEQFTVFAKDNAGNTAVSQINEQNILPSIGTIADATVDEDGSVEIQLVVSDDTTAIQDLKISTVSSNTAVQPAVNAYEREGSMYIMIAPLENENTGTGHLTMTVTVEDEDGDSVDTTFKLTVTPVNDAPTAVDDTASTAENTSVIIDVLDNDTDIEGDTLTIESYTQPTNGTVTQVGQTLRFTPNTDWAGEDSFTYYSTDSHERCQASVTVSVANQNDAPVAVDDTAQTNEDVPVVINVLDNDSDEDIGVDPDEELTVSLSPDTVVYLGSVSLSNNVITYNPSSNAYGQETFDYILTDKAGLSDTATVTVTIDSINDAPSLSGYPTDYTIPEDSINTQFTFNIDDVETANENLMVQVVSQDASLISNDNLSFSVDNATGVVTVTLSTVPQKNGTLDIKLLVSDGVESKDYMLPVTVSPQNDGPSGTDDDMQEAWVVFEDIAKTLDLSVLTENDTDIDADELTVTQVSNVSSGTLVKDSGQNYIYTSAAGFSGVVTFTYTLSDGTATATANVTMKVLESDDQPTIALEPTNDYDCVEDLFENKIKVYCSDEDTDYADLHISAESSNEVLLSSDNITITDLGSGVYELSFAPTEHGNGTADITVYLSDGTTKVHETFTYTITPAQDAPVALNDSYEVAQGRTEYIIPIANDYDFDNEPLDTVAVEGFTLPAEGRLVRCERGFKYTAPTDANGTYTFTYKITDGIDEAQATVTLLVGNYDDLNIPEVSGIGNVKAIINSILSDIPFTASHTNGIATVEVVSSNQTIIKNSDLNIIDNGSGSYTLKLALMPNVTGVTDITITVTSTNGRVAKRQFSVNVFPDNKKPVAVDDTLTGAIEDTDYTFTPAQLLSNDTDAEGDNLSIVSLSAPAGSRAYFTFDGTNYTYHPNPNEFGDVTFDYWITDGNSVSLAGTVTLQVQGTDDLPDGDTDYYTVPNNDGESITITKADLVSNDDDVDGDTLYFYRLDGEYETVTFDGDGNLVYTRKGVSTEGHGRDIFKYYVADEDPSVSGFNESTDRELEATTVVIQDEYPPSFWLDNVYKSCDEDADTFTVNVSFHKSDGYSGTFKLLQPSPSKGTVVIDENTYTEGTELSMTYKPNDGATGSDSFTYSIQDTQTGTTKSATVYMYIRPVNDAPQFTVNPETDWVRDEEGSVTLNVEFSDEDNSIDDVDIKVYITNQSNSNPIALTKDIVVTRDTEDLHKATATVPFVKDANGTLTVVFEITDGINYTRAESNGTVNPVDDPPTTPNILVDAIEEDTSVKTDVMTLVSDVDNSTSELTLSVSVDAEHGEAVLEDGQILYIPEFNYYGTDVLTYKVVSPGGQFSEGTITYTISEVNDAPYIFDVEYYNVTDEDVQATVNFKAFDYEDDESHSDASEVTYTFESSNTAIIPVENIALQPYTDEIKQLKIDPAANKFGSSVITIVATDTDGAVTRLEFNMVVTSVNDLPEGNPDIAETNEDCSVTFSVLGNDSDIEDSEFPDDDLKIKIVEISQGTNGGVAINAGGGQITYSPLLNYNGTDTLTYTLMDSFGETVEVTVTITINPVNDPPVAIDDEGYVEESGQVQINLIENDTDIEIDTGENSDVLSITAVTDNLPDSSVSFENGVLTYNAPDDIVGTQVDEVTYTVSDGHATDTGSVFITIGQVNDPPVAVNNAGNHMNAGGDRWEFNEDTTGVFVVDISDPETESSKLLVTMTSDGQAYVEDANIQVENTAEGNKRISMVPKPNEFGDFTITFKVSDGEAETTVLFPVTIVPVNDNPVLTVVDLIAYEEISESKTATATDVETSAENLVYSLKKQATHGTATVDPNGKYTYTSDVDYNGQDSFEVTVTDEGNLTNTQTVDVTVWDVNDAPNAADDSYTIDEMDATTVSTFNVLANDTDVDLVYSDSLTIVDVTTPTHGSAVINANKIDYTPQQYNNKPSTFDYTVRDEGGEESTATVTVSFNAIDNDPFDGDDAYTIEEDCTAQLFDVLVNDDVDIDTALNVSLDTLTLLSVTATTPANSQVCEVENNKLKYQPALNFNGADEVTYKMRDANEATEYTFTVNISVTPVNDIPTISDIADKLTGNLEDTNVVTSCDISDVETAVDDLSVTAIWDNDTLIDSVQISNTGATRTITVVPEANMSGEAEITVKVTDGESATAEDKFSVVIVPVDDTPTPLDHDDIASTDENTTIYIDVLANDDVDLMCEGDDLGIVVDSIAESTSSYGGTYNIVQKSVEQPIINADGTTTITNVTRDVIEFIPVSDWTLPEGQTLDVVVTYTMFEIGAEGTVYEATHKLTITVTPVNDAPTIDIKVAGDTGDTDELTILEDAVDGTGVITVEVNDEEDGNATLSVTLDSITEAPGNYSPTIATLLESGVTISADTDDTRTLQAIMQENENGTVDVKLKVTDSNGEFGYDTLTVIVQPVQDPPSGGDDQFETDEDTSILLDVLANDDVDQSTQGSLSTIERIVSQPGNGTATIEGSKIRYTPDQDYFNDCAGPEADDTFQYEMKDGNDAKATFTVTMYVNAVNDAPVLYFVDDEAPDDNKIKTPEETPRTLVLYAVDVDNDVADIQLTGVSSNTIVVMNSDITITGPTDNSGNAYFDVSAAPFLRWNGVTNLTFTVTDPYARNTAGYETLPVSVQTVELTVEAVNQPPEPQVDHVSMNEGQTKSFGVVANDYDPDEDTNPAEEDLTVQSVSFSASETNTHVGSFTVSGDKKSVVFTPASGYESWNGVLSFEYVVVDKGLETATQQGCTLTINQVNDPPVAVPDSITIDEGTGVSFNILENDTDIDMDTNLNANPGAESIWVVADGFTGVHSSNAVEYDSATQTFTYTPDINFNGVDELYYQLTDGEETVQGTVTITVNPLKDDPTAVADDVTVEEETPITIDVTANDVDTDSLGELNLDLTEKNDGTLTVIEVNGLTISGVMDTTNGSVELVGNKLKYTGDADFVGDDSFTYTIRNSDGRTHFATVTVTVTNANDTPTAQSVSAAIVEGDPAQSFDINTIIDDADLYNPGSTEELAVTIVDSTYPSDVSFDSGTKIVTFTPKTNFNGAFVITYKVTDKANAYAQNTITITVAPVQDSPTAADDTGIVIAEEATVTIDVTANDSDIDSDALLNLDLGEKNDGSLTIVEIDGQPISGAMDTAHGSVVLDSGQLKYTGDTDFVGNDSFTYTIRNSDNNTDTATVYVTVTDVNDTPTAQSLTDTIDEDDPAQTYDIDPLVGDADFDNPGSTEALTVTIVDSTYPSDITFDNLTNKVTYTPQLNFNGDFVITYRVTDSKNASAENTITITVKDGGDTPVSNADSLEIDEDEFVSVWGLLDVLSNDSDLDESTNPDIEDIKVTDVTYNNMAYVDMQIPANGIGVEVKTRADWNGVVTFTYTVTDVYGLSSSATSTLTVKQVNDAPVAGADEAQTPEETPITFNIISNDSDVDMSSILNADPSGDSLTISNVTGALNGTLVYAAGEVTYSPKADFNGIENITYTLSDEHGGSVVGSVSIEVIQVLESPRAQDDMAAVGEDAESVPIYVLLNDYDPDSDTSLNESPTDLSLTVTNVTIPMPSGCGTAQIEDNHVVLYPAKNFHGTVTMTYTVENSTGRKDTANITVIVSDSVDIPIAQDGETEVFEDSSIEVDMNEFVSDADVGDDLTVAIVADCQHGTASVDSGNVLKYTPKANYNGTDSITYTVTDGDGLSSSAILTIIIMQVNDAPMVLPDTASGQEDTALSIVVLENDSDIDTDHELNARPQDEWLEVVPDGFGGVDNGTVTINGGLVIFTPNDNWHGTDEFEYTAIDQSGVKVKGTITVTIEPVTDAPMAVEGYANELDEDDSITYDTTDLVFDPDVETMGDVITYSIKAQPINGEAIIDSSNKITYVPKANFNGSDAFTLKAVDSEQQELITVVTVHVNQVNDRPSARDTSASCDEDTSVTIDVLANSSDVDKNKSLNEFPGNERLSIVSNSFEGLTNGTVEIENGELVYTPDKNFNGEEIFTCKVRDKGGKSDTATVVVTVNPVLDIPTIVKFTLPHKGDKFVGGDEASAEWTIENPEGVDLVYTLELFDGESWKTIGEELDKQKLSCVIEENIRNTDKAKFAVTGYYDGKATNRVESNEFVIGGTMAEAAIIEHEVMEQEDDTIIITLSGDDKKSGVTYVYSVDGGETKDVVDGEITVEEGAKVVVVYARDEEGNLTVVDTIIIEDELLVQGSMKDAEDGKSDANSYWYILLIAAGLGLIIILLALYRNIIFEFTYEDDSTKTVKMFKRYKKDGIITELERNWLEGAVSVKMTMKERITEKMRENTVTVTVGEVVMKVVEVPEDAEGRFEDIIA